MRHELALGAHAVEDLQEHGSQQLLGRNTEAIVLNFSNLSGKKHSALNSSKLTIENNIYQSVNSLFSNK